MIIAKTPNHLAEAYEKVRRDDDARRELKKILDMTPDPNYLPEYKEASTDAQKLLDQIDHTGADVHKAA